MKQRPKKRSPINFTLDELEILDDETCQKYLFPVKIKDPNQELSQRDIVCAQLRNKNNPNSGLEHKVSIFHFSIKFVQDHLSLLGND